MLATKITEFKTLRKELYICVLGVDCTEAARTVSANIRLESMLP